MTRYIVTAEIEANDLAHATLEILYPQGEPNKAIISITATRKETDR